MKKTLFIAAFFAAILAVSCQQKELEQPVCQTAETVTFTCVINPDTRLGISDAGKTTWEAGDEILVHGEGDSNRIVYTLQAPDISSDGKTATIAVAIDESGENGIKPYDRSDKGYTSTIYAMYPASAAVSGNLYYYARFSDTNKPLMAAYNVGNTFVFYNLCGVISFKVSGPFDAFEFKGNNGETVGYERYQSRLAATAEDPVLQYNYASDNGTTGPVTKITGDVEADGSTVHYICIPNGVNFTAGFTFNFFDGEDLVMVAKTNTAVEVPRNGLLVLGDISDKLEEYTPPTSSDHKSSITGATNLSSNGCANCYVVEEAGSYKLPAVKGCSGEDAGNVFGVKLLWETWNTAEEVTENSVIAEVDFDGPENYIYFKTPATLKPGNALIAALDAQENIIWSWHIWIPESEINTNTYGLGGSELMDRNLGALDADLSIGLDYQWGRKDPFPGPATVPGEAPMTIAGTAISVNHDDATAQGSVPKSIASPTTIYTTNNAHWSAGDEESLWAGAKSNYDPCPPGYRVPTRADVPGLFASDLSATEGWVKNADECWFKIGSPAASFPMCGYLDDYNASFKYTHVGDRVAIWSADSNGAKKGYAVDVRFDKGTQTVGGPAKSRLAAVRCIVD
ncbi:MAG: hypothetical protein J5533_01335 [Bacteroidales bacterium]|nr:hypothetical protein [Bacteroidales bacterium]